MTAANARFGVIPDTATATAIARSKSLRAVDMTTMVEKQCDRRYRAYPRNE